MMLRNFFTIPFFSLDFSSVFGRFSVHDRNARGNARAAGTFTPRRDDAPVRNDVITVQRVLKKLHAGPEFARAIAR